MVDDPFEAVDSSGLTDADWAEINKLKRAYKEGGKPALNKAMAILAETPAVHCRHGRIFPRNDTRSYQ